ncbi:hypothetical protein IC232_04775 [Microvirga sp. BT688]|uniref:hypothetical protein n=1 Tax=Microvirga sp. TaxID=1873136 RepID=UPI001687DA38|nr:hypothetical protein [Microvirga sp.]MBD2746010.1 hypothetical protein [Microvirga sp.]
MTMRRAQNDNSRFHLGYLTVNRRDPHSGAEVRFDRLDILLTDAVFEASNGGIYRKLRAKGQNGEFYYGSAFAGKERNFTKSMTLVVYYGSEKLTVPVPVADLAVGDISSLELSCCIQATHQTARPVAPDPEVKQTDLQEARLWSVTETFIRAQSIKEKGHLTKLRRAVTLIYHPDPYEEAEREIRTRIIARANDLIDKMGQQIAA